jgi:hypothetical protein
VAQGKQHAAYALLSALYGGFSEGGESLDLQEAHTLLEALQGQDAAATPAPLVAAV